MNWISVSEKLPERGQRVLVYVKNMPDYPRNSNKITIGWRVHKVWADYGIEWDTPEHVTNVTHWMPLPDEPTQDQDTFLGLPVVIAKWLKPWQWFLRPTKDDG